ncbi:MAG: winged helix DNA-binding domain-containing protein [Chloroflexi bacterium]|nr:winged helix DNA-binding domain-containing protein [Chloroflexota bacterium]
MRGARLELTRDEILAFRRSVQALDERLPPGPASLRRAAWAGLQDSMPRAALLSIHARVEGTRPTTWEDRSLVQLWGPRYSAYVVAKRDIAVFTLGRLLDDAEGLRRAVDLAARLDTLLAGLRVRHEDAARPLHLRHPNYLRYAAPSGRVLIRWDGARQPLAWTVRAPRVDPGEAGLELARRYLHVFGPASPSSFAQWAGISPARASAAFDALARALVPVRTPVGEASILASDEAAFRVPIHPPAPARLLPSGDSYFLLQGTDRALLVPDAKRRSALWTSRVWPGAILADGEVVATWRRAHRYVTIAPWKRLSRAQRAAIDAEATSLPLPDVAGDIAVRWAEAS